MDNDDYEIVSKILASKHRLNIVIALLGGPKTPTELSNRFDEHQPTISRALGELREMGVVESTSQQRGRLYWIPQEKEYIANFVKEREEKNEEH